MHPSTTVILFVLTFIISINAHYVRHPSKVGIAPCNDNHLHPKTVERSKNTTDRGENDLNAASGTTVPLCLYKEHSLHSIWFRNRSGVKHDHTKGAYTGDTYLFTRFLWHTGTMTLRGEHIAVNAHSRYRYSQFVKRGNSFSTCFIMNMRITGNPMTGDAHFQSAILGEQPEWEIGSYYHPFYVVFDTGPCDAVNVTLEYRCKGMSRRPTLFIDQSILQEGNYSIDARAPDPPNRYAKNEGHEPTVILMEGDMDA